MIVESASFTQGGVTTQVIKERVTMSTNCLGSERTTEAVAQISVPVDGSLQGTIRTVGNASVVASTRAKSLTLSGGLKKMKSTSKSGGFAVAWIGFQDSEQMAFLNVIFGHKGQPESLDTAGSKQRPHIAFYPDGNGKFIRLSGRACELECDMTYDIAERRALADKVRIRLLDCAETLECIFTFKDGDETELSGIRFVDAE